MRAPPSRARPASSRLNIFGTLLTELGNEAQRMGTQERRRRRLLWHSAVMLSARSTGAEAIWALWFEGATM
jgi:hypothetical protein